MDAGAYLRALLQSTRGHRDALQQDMAHTSAHINKAREHRALALEAERSGQQPSAAATARDRPQERARRAREHHANYELHRAMAAASLAALRKQHARQYAQIISFSALVSSMRSWLELAEAPQLLLAPQELGAPMSC
eukprot:m51a1_g8509 hypothetical protein (137) ;mRNA; r:74885-75295